MKESNLLFLETCHWTDIVSSKVMYDGSKPFYPLLKHTKIQKHQIRKTEERKCRKVRLGGRLLFLAAMDNVNNLNWGKKLPTSQPITPRKSPATFYPLPFHPSLNEVIVLSILPSTTCSFSGAIKTVYCQQRQAVHWLMY